MLWIIFIRITFTHLWKTDIQYSLTPTQNISENPNLFILIYVAELKCAAKDIHTPFSQMTENNSQAGISKTGNLEMKSPPQCL